MGYVDREKRSYRFRFKEWRTTDIEELYASYRFKWKINRREL
jgi:hypothetical protein